MTDGLTDQQQPDVQQEQIQDGEESPGGSNPSNPAYESAQQTLDEAETVNAGVPEQDTNDDAAAKGDSAEDSDSTGDADSGAETDGAEDGDEEDDDGDDEDEGDPLDVEGEVAADYLEELLDIADLDGDIDTYVDGGRAHVSVVSDNNTLVGAKGEVLDALQELARLAVMTETGNRSRLMLDVAGYREQRRKELQELATEAVDEAKSSAEPVRLSPMNPFERKIVHDAVAAAGLSSESEGEEPKRRVVVLPSA